MTYADKMKAFAAANTAADALNAQRRWALARWIAEAPDGATRAARRCAASAEMYGAGPLAQALAADDR